jgi:hypothetical protein
MKPLRSGAIPDWDALCAVTGLMAMAMATASESESPLIVYVGTWEGGQ